LYAAGQSFTAIAAGRALAFEDLAVGQRATLSRTVADGEGEPTSGDRLPFGQPIASGFATLGLVAELLGTQLPGPGGVFLSQTTQFLGPVRDGDEVTAHVEVVELVPAHGRARLFFECVSGGRAVFEGEAWIAVGRRAPA
jgi:3-hydroxybutyryl-CoA dehydratase